MCVMRCAVMRVNAAVPVPIMSCLSVCMPECDADHLLPPLLTERGETERRGEEREDRGVM